MSRLETLFNVIVGFCVGFLGGWDALLLSLLVLATIDVCSGIIKSLMLKSEKSDHGGLNSTVLRIGMGRKIMMLFVVSVAFIIDMSLGGGSFGLRNLVIGCYIVSEALSILENVGQCGLPLPLPLTQVLDRLNEENNK